MKQLKKNIFVETEFQGCKTGFLVTADGLVLIDSPHRPSDGIRYRNEIEKHGSVRYLINTEPHGDHIASNFLFPAIYIAHKGTREKMAAKESLDRLKMQLREIDPDFVEKLDDFYLPLPDVTFNDLMTIHIGEHTVKLINLPGHTASETAVLIQEENVVFTGDNIFCNVPSFLHEALPSAWIESLEKLKKLDAEFYIPGHGGVCDKSYLDEQASVIREWMDVLMNAVNKGWSLEETQERVTFLDRYTLDDEFEIIGKELENMGIAHVYALARNGEM